MSNQMSEQMSEHWLITERNYLLIGGVERAEPNMK